MIRRVLFSLLGFAWLAPGQEEKKSQEAKGPEAKKLTNEELREMLKEDIFLLDVREPKELEELGTLKGYVNIPLGQLEARLGELPKDKRILVA